MPIFEMFHAGRPTAEYLVGLHREQARMPVTYAEIGGTLGTLPPRWHHLRVSRIVSGPEHIDGFDRGREAIRTWAAHRELSLLLEPEYPSIEEDSVVVFALPMKPSGFWATGACRIVKVVDEPDRFGFAYGTLPHHPERGEESFLVDRDSRTPHVVTFTITAFSRGATLPMRLAGPFGRLIQRRAAETYLNGFERFVRAG